MVEFLNRKLVVLVVVALLGGCQGPAIYVPEGKQPQATASLAVSDLSVIMEDDGVQDQSRQWVSASLSDQVKSWFSRRFQADGGKESGHIVIRQVALKETILPKTASIKAIFSKQPAEQYDALIDVAFEIKDSNGFAQQSVTAQVQRATVATEGISLVERQVLVQKLINQVLVDLDREFVKNMRSFLPLLIQSESTPDF